jgi:hypothetical protein
VKFTPRQVKCTARADEASADNAVRRTERSENSANSLVRIDGICLRFEAITAPLQPDLTGCCLGLGKAPSFVSKDEAHHCIKEQRFVRYRTGIMVAMS